MEIDFRVKYSTEDSSVQINDEMKNYFVNMLGSVLNQLKDNLVLPDNCKIIIPDNFEKELFEFQAEKGLAQEYTKSPMGVAFAKVLDFVEGEIFYSVIFINKALIFALQSDDSIDELSVDQKDDVLRWRGTAINVIHHELVHMHDEQIAGERYKDIFEGCNLDLMGGMKKLALVVWKEYYAFRISASTYNWEELEGEFNNMIKQIEYVEDKTRERIWEYRLSDDLDALVQKVGEDIPTLVNYAAYLLGKLSYNKSIEVLNEYLDLVTTKLSDTFFYNIWKGMNEDLNQIFSVYPELNSKTFDNLSYTLLKCWNELGMFPKDTDEGLYVSIP
jgi:hypothetical protein